MMRSRMNTLDMVGGPIFSRLLVYSVPIILSGLLQLTFNAADIAVVGRFTGSDALAAVSASGPISSLIVNLFMGLSVGANVLCAQFAGARREEDFRQTVHTAIAVALCIGLGMLAVGIACARSLLGALGTPQEILPLASTYLWIYFCGVPATMVYNFGAAILRSVGDTRHPLYYLAFSGLLNVCLNLLFVIAFHMGVAGVAIATVLSQYVSAWLVIQLMLTSHDLYRLEPARLRLHGDKLRRMLAIGVPAGVQSSMFSVSNLLIQSAINSFGAQVMAAAAVAGNVDAFCYVAIDALSQAALSFTGQNFGAKQYRRIDRIFLYTMAMGLALSLVIGIGVYLLSPWILPIFTADPQVMEYARQILFVVAVFQFVNGTMNISFNVVRGMNHSVFPMVSTIICVCVLRVVWIYTVFAQYHTLTVLYLSYPVTKGLAALTGMICFLKLRSAWPKGEAKAPAQA